MSEIKSMSAADEAAWNAQLQSPPPPPAAPPPPPPPAPASPPPPAAPAPKPDDDVEGSLQAQDGKKYVPVATFVEQRKALKGQVDDLKAMLDQANAQIGVLLRTSTAQAPASPPPPPPPPATNPHDKDLEPLEHARWELGKANERLAALEGRTAQQDQLTQQQQVLAQQHQAYIKAHDAFVSKNPEYAQAYEFAVQQLVDYHINVLGQDQATAVASAANAEWQIVTQAVAENKNPFERLWQMAKWRGFTPKPPQAPAGETEAQKTARLAAAGSAAISLSAVPGSTANIGPTAEALAGLSKEKFAAALADDTDGEKWRKLAGG